MPFTDATADDLEFLKAAHEEALRGYGEGGLPIGAVMVEDGSIIARGRNRRVQDGDAIAHGEMDCIRNAGRRPGYGQVTLYTTLSPCMLYTTLSPCMMCAGTILQFGIPRVVVGEDRNFAGNAHFLAERGVEVVLLEDRDCMALMARFIAERPALWDEDIARE